MNKKHLIIFVCVMILVLRVFTACSPTKQNDIKITYTNQVITQQELRGIFYTASRDKFSSATYETVDYDWLVNNYYDYFSKMLFDANITKWDKRANCVVFCQKYIVEANLLYYRANFHSNKETSRLSIGMVWYLPNVNNITEAHAIIAAFTNRGWIYIDPQLPKGRNVVNLTAAQVNSIYLREI